MRLPTLDPTLRLDAAVASALERLWEELEGEIRSLGVVCWVRGDCCDFERCDHRLYASSVEIAHVRAEHPGPFPAGSALCPFWCEGKCTERDRRPLGCRTYFCDPRFRDVLEAIHERYYRRIRDLAVERGIPWLYAPFVAAMRDGGPAPSGEPPGGSVP